jgi:U4/U6 small nuclear ribonucleoprotein PRP3
MAEEQKQYESPFLNEIKQKIQANFVPKQTSARRFTMDPSGKLLDEKGIEVDLSKGSTYSLKVNQERFAKKEKKNALRYQQMIKKSGTAFSRGDFYDVNLPKKRDRKMIKGLIFDENEEVVLRAELVPDLEWWDKPLIKSDRYIEIPAMTQRSMVEEIEKIAIKDAAERVRSMVRQILPDTIEFRTEEITGLVTNPPPVTGDQVTHASHTVTMHLTKREKKKIKRLKKARKLKELREKIKLGLIAPPPPKIKLSTWMKVVSHEIASDPTRTEQDIMQKYNQRLQEHLKRNEERKLTKEQKLEKILRKLRRDSARGSRVALFRIERLQHRKNLFKIQKNASQLALVGICVRNKENLPVLLAVEGGKRAIKFYKRLCLHRVEWELDDSRCSLVWEGEIKDPIFKKFEVVEVNNEVEIVRTLKEKGCVQYWDMVKKCTSSQNI